MDSMSARVDRVERELEYLENKIPSQSDIEMEEALLEQQIKAAELDQLKKKAKLTVGKGRNRESVCVHVCLCVWAGRQRVAPIMMTALQLYERKRTGKKTLKIDMREQITVDRQLKTGTKCTAQEVV